MKSVSNNVKNALKKPTTQRKGVILVNGNYYDIYNVEYYGDCYDDGKVIGNAIASQLDFDIPYMPKFDTFQYFDCVLVGNSYEYIDFGTFTVFDEQDQDEFNKHITAFDNLIKFNKPFESRGSYPKTLYEELSNVCEQANVELANDSIPNGDFIVENNQFVNGESLKTVLKSISGISGNYAIVKNNALHLQLTNTTSEVITKNQHEPVDWKRRSYGINQVIIGDSQVEGEYVIREDTADIALNGVHKLEIKDNLFAYTQAKRNALIDNLFNRVRGFGYIPYETKGEWLSYLEIGDTINLDGVDTIVLRINAKSPQSLESIMSAPAIIDSSIEYVDNTANVDNRMKLTERSVDKQNQIINDVVSNVTEQNTKIANIQVTVDEINSKISDIADVTVSAEDTDGQVELTNINESEPIQIKIRPIGENISYLYPSTGLFPSPNLYLKRRTIRFTRTYTENEETLTEEIDYELPDDLLYYDENTYDEFYLDYDSETCQVTKRCQYNADGTVSPLANEQIVPYEYPTIILGSGDYTVCLLGYTNAYIMVRLMVSNIYTTQFATKVEMRTAIEQTSQEINIEVAKKVGSNEVISKINLSPESATISANKVNINGIITAINNNTTTTIDGNKITTGSITADKVSSDIITTTNFSAQSIDADQITSGRISADRLDSSVITTDNLSAQTISANNIYGGTISASRIVLGDNSGTNFAVGYDGIMYARNCQVSGEISGSFISGSSIDVVNGSRHFTATSDALQMSTASGGFLSLTYTTHPYVSALNVAQGSGGVLFKSGTTQSNPGSITYGLLDITTDYGGNSFEMYSRNGVDVVINPGDGSNNAYVWYRSSNYKIAVSSSGPSSLNVKKNLKPLDDEYDELYKDMENVNAYNYDYKYKNVNGDLTKDYGFIIDEIENTKHLSKYFRNYKTKRWIKGNKLINKQKNEDMSKYEELDIKEWDRDSYIKGLFVMIKTLQHKIEKLEEKYEQTI